MIVEVSFLRRLRLSSCVLIDMDYVSCTINRTHVALAEQLVKRTIIWGIYVVRSHFYLLLPSIRPYHEKFYHRLSTADRRRRHQYRLLSQSDMIRLVLIGLLKPTNNCHERTWLGFCMSFSTLSLSHKALLVDIS